MSDNSTNVHFSGVRFICTSYLTIKWVLAPFGSIYNGKIWAANESYALKINIIVILLLCIGMVLTTTFAHYQKNAMSTLNSLHVK